MEGDLQVLGQLVGVESVIEQGMTDLLTKLSAVSGRELASRLQEEDVPATGRIVSDVLFSRRDRELGSR